MANDMPLLAAVYACDVDNVERLASQSGAMCAVVERARQSDDVITLRLGQRRRSLWRHASSRGNVALIIVVSVVVCTL